MTLNFDLFWSFRSPYSYLATQRLVDMEKQWDLKIAVRPVYPIAVRDEAFFEKVNPLWPPYLFRDTIRIAERLGIIYRWPNPDPVYMDPETGRYPKQQPYIYRLTRLGVAATERGRGMSFIDEVSKVIWTGTENWHQGEHLADAAKRAGLDLAELDAAIEADESHYESAIQQNQDALEQAGHWGVPCMVFEGEPFFGQDRLDDLLWRLQQQGLEPRR